MLVFIGFAGNLKFSLSGSVYGEWVIGLYGIFWAKRGLLWPGCLLVLGGVSWSVVIGVTSKFVAAFTKMSFHVFLKGLGLYRGVQM